MKSFIIISTILISLSIKLIAQDNFELIYSDIKKDQKSLNLLYGLDLHRNDTVKKYKILNTTKLNLYNENIPSKDFFLLFSELDTLIIVDSKLHPDFTIPSKLKLLVVVNCRLTHSPILPNSLETLNLSYNGIDKLENLISSIRHLDIQNNNIENFKLPIYVQTLNISNNKLKVKLEPIQNQIIYQNGNLINDLDTTFNHEYLKEINNYRYLNMFHKTTNSSKSSLVRFGNSNYYSNAEKKKSFSVALNLPTDLDSIISIEILTGTSCNGQLGHSFENRKYTMYYKKGVLKFDKDSNYIATNNWRDRYDTKITKTIKHKLKNKIKKDELIKLLLEIQSESLVFNFKNENKSINFQNLYWKESNSSCNASHSCRNSIVIKFITKTNEYSNFYSNKNCEENGPNVWKAYSYKDRNYLFTWLTFKQIVDLLLPNTEIPNEIFPTSKLNEIIDIYQDN
jgi:hypothetical protein